MEIDDKEGTESSQPAASLLVSEPENCFWHLSPVSHTDQYSLIIIYDNRLWSPLMGSSFSTVDNLSPFLSKIFEASADGTLFLDEIGGMPSPQATLLTFLDSSEFRRIGGFKKAECAIITATHQNLEVLTRNCRFRSDLLFRLRASSLNIPPLAQPTVGHLPPGQDRPGLLQK